MCTRRHRGGQGLLGRQRRAELAQHLLLLLGQALLRHQHVLDLAVVAAARLHQLRLQGVRALSPEVDLLRQTETQSRKANMIIIPKLKVRDQ